MSKLALLVLTEAKIFQFQELRININHVAVHNYPLQKGTTKVPSLFPSDMV
jgi:hypothetical protein